MNPNELKMLIALQPMIKKAMGRWRLGDISYCAQNEKFVYCHEPALCDILIPLPIDPVNPERGLVGMADGDYKQLCKSPFTDEWLFKPNFSGLDYFEADTPTEAILKALCEQEGVKV
jgi:hypothetical protein